MATHLSRDRLPPGWNLAVTQDGRIFFINDIQRTTSWLHPVTGEPVMTGLQYSPDLPPGWEQDVTNEGQVFFVDHNRRLTTFDHPRHGPSHPSTSSLPRGAPEQQYSDGTHNKENFKRGDAKQRSVKAPTAKRNPNSEVVRRGWLHRLETSGITKTWKRRWCVLADFALFVYKSDDEAVTLTSILLPSYRINHCTEADNIKRNFAFKIEHENTKTLYFAVDEQPDFLGWMSYLRQAAMMNGNAGFQREANNNIRQFPAGKYPQDSSQVQPQSAAADDPSRHPKNQPHQPGRALAPNAGPRLVPGRVPAPDSGPSMAPGSTYKGYGDPTGPMNPGEGQRLPREYENPIYNSLTSAQQSRQGFPAQDGNSSLNSSLNRGSQVYPPGSRDQLLNPNQSHSSGSFRADPRLQQSNPGQQLVRNGFPSNSTRNSLTQSDSLRSGQAYNPIQTEQQQHLGHPERGSTALEQRRGGSVRDSLSDTENRVKYLNRWDQNFPSLDEEHLKHGSFDDLLDVKAKHVDKSNTFNARSKSHENFSQFPNSQQPQKQIPKRPVSQYVEHQPPAHLPRNTNYTAQNSTPQGLNLNDRQQTPAHLPRNSQYQAQNNSLQGLNDRQQPPAHLPRNTQYQAQNNSLQGLNDRQQPVARDHYNYQGPGLDGTLQSSGSSQGSSLQRSPPYQPQREFQRTVQQPPLARDPSGFIRDSRDAQRSQDYPQQTSQAVDSPRGSSRAPGTQSFISDQQIPQQQQQQLRPRIPRQHPPQGAQPRTQQAPPYERRDLHLSINNPAQSPHSFQNHNSPHIYMNLPNRNMPADDSYTNSDTSASVSPPTRPPYPSSVRQEMVEDLAQTRTPTTQKDLLTSNQMNSQRMQQPAYFQYPSPRDQQNKQNSLERNNTALQKQMFASSQNQPQSRLSGASHTSQSSRSDRKDGPQSPQDSFSRTNMMDPEAQKLRFAYERVHSLRLAPDKAPPRRQPAQIQTVKEDPNMSDRDILETNLEKIAKKNPLSGPRLRMSISAGDLIGKTHDELVLLLIQLRRNQAGLGKAKDVHRSQMEHRRQAELDYRKQMHQYGKVVDKHLQQQHEIYMEAKGHIEEIENKLEVYKPIINLLDNMVTMGSLYGGDNLMLASQYRKHLLRPDQYQPPKKMLEFSRKQQEERLIQKTEEEIKQLSSEEVDLEEKIDRLNELDRRLQEQSVRVSSFREDKELMERALNGVLKQQDASRDEPRENARMTQQHRLLEKEISRVTQQLAEASKELEETAAENSKLEYEVALLRTKVHGELPRSRSVPSLASENVRTKMKMEKELAKVEGIMQGLNKEGARLSEAMSTFRRSSSSSQLANALDREDGKRKGGTYLQTDLDSGEQIDLANIRERVAPARDTSHPVASHQRQSANTSDDWDVENADENTKRYFGLLPKEKPKGLTVRDVKRQAEQRREREKILRDEEDYNDGEEIKLRVSNVDNETSSIIHARIPSYVSDQGKWESGHPQYENLRYSVPVVPETHSAPGSRRSSLVLMAPKPFTPYQDKTARPFRSELELNSSSEPQFNSSLGREYNGQTHLSDSMDRQYRSAEILNNLQQDSRRFNGNEMPHGDGHFRSTSGEISPYEHDVSRNSFSSQNQMSSGQFQAKPGQFQTQPDVFDPRSQSAVLGNSPATDVMKPTQIDISNKQPSSTDNFLQNPESDPPASAFHIIRPVNFISYNPSSTAYTPRPWSKPSLELGGNIFNVKKNPKGRRYLTISSSEPLKLERNILLNRTLHSTAGDLILSRPIDDVPDIIKSSQTKVDQIDDKTIDREILYIPEKVYIPERYDAEADAEQLTEEEKLRRKEKAERIKRLLASQSVMSMSQTDISQLDNSAHSRIQKEQKERTHFLTLNQELARQVTLQSKKQAAERRKTWSGAQFADAKRQYEEQLEGFAT
ncbi:hypothetical protein BsWGS_06984 [Bradybaena similaris]